MRITRRLAHKVHNHLTVALGFIDLDRKEEAKKELQKLAALLASHTETAAEESAREAMEDRER